MAEHGRQEREPVGSVAEETARLVEALGGWAEGLRAHDRDGSPPAERAGKGADEAADEGAGEAADEGAGNGRQGARRTTACEHCGASSRPGEAATCQLCPLCQGIALLRTVRPETVERLADLAAALSGALRDVAADRFGQAAPPHRPSPPPRGHRVQDIAVDDEDDPRSAHTDQSRRTQESTAP